jgi:hypothetical protein
MARPGSRPDHPRRRSAAALPGGPVRARATAFLLAPLVALAIVADGVLMLSGASATPAPHSYLQVTQIEYRLLLSRGVVKAGPVHLEEIDGGMDQHNLNLRYERSANALAEPLLTPGQRYDTVVVLKPGIYHLWCSLPGHWALGMHAILKVVR